MKKYIQIFVVLALVLAVVGIARANTAWAGKSDTPVEANPATGLDLTDPNIAQPMSIVVTGSGSYLVGGICKYDATFTATDIKDNVDAEKPVAETQKVPFFGKGDLFFPGCHVVHYKQDKVVDQADTKDGSWKICFGKRPDIKITIYYYLDSDTSPVWSPLSTSVEGAYACASAIYSGVYMPAGEVLLTPGGDQTISGVKIIPPAPGTVPHPPQKIEIRASGTYGNGICMLDALYKVDNLADDLWLEFPVEDTLFVTFPDNGDMLFFPGCHLLHYENSIVQEEMGPDKGTWKICFAAQPDKKMTIYFYTSTVHVDQHEDITPPWTALTTTIENGLACAPAENTGVYVPAGQ